VPGGLRIVVAVGVLVTATVSETGAQSMTSPPGSVRGLFGADGPPSPGRTTQQISTWFDLAGGYDQNLDLSGSTGATDVEGVATTALGGFRFWRGRSTRSIEATARVFRNEQSAGRTTATGGEVNLNGTLELGRRGGLALALRAANDSAILFGALGPAFAAPPAVDPEIDVPDVSPQQGDVRDRWYTLGANATAFRNWTVRHRTTAQYTQVRRRPTNDQGLDSDQRLVNLRHDWMFRMNAGLLASYRFERVRQTFPDALLTEPIRTQSAEAGFRYERRVSPIRTFSLAVQGGATQVLGTETAAGPVDGTIEPSGSLTASYTLTRQWVLVAGATRGITVLQGIAQVPFTSDLASLAVSGVLARRFTVVVSGSLSQGSALGDGPGNFDAVGGSATVRYGFRYGGLFAGYTRYEHRIREVIPVPGSVMPRFNQTSIRAGVTLWLPLYGAF
jgi:hypothetical protein